MPRHAPTTERQALLRKRLERFTRLLHGIEDGDPNAVHRTRVASRRLREVLPVLSLDADVAHKLRRRLRKITDRLGRVREHDVLHHTIKELEKHPRYSKKALGLVADHVGEPKSDDRKRALEKVPSSDL